MEERIRTGVAAATGIAIGKVLIWKNRVLPVTKRTVTDCEGEKDRYREAVAAARRELVELRSKVAGKLGAAEGEIIEAHLLMAEDPELTAGVLQKITEEKVNAEYALESVIHSYEALLEGVDDPYLRERGADLRDVKTRIIRLLQGEKGQNQVKIEKECIVVADDLVPSETAQLDQGKVLGFVTAKGGMTSHTAILARSLGIPAVVGLGEEISQLAEGKLLIVDGAQGVVISQPSADCLRVYQEKQEKARAERARNYRRLAAVMGEEAISKDGKRVIIAANIGAPVDIEQALAHGCDGIGLFRTEFLYMSKNHLPTEEEQFAAYREVLEKMGEKPVIIRTLDIGGDKHLPYLQLEEESNPALGYRAIRICLDQTAIFQTQLRAMLRAAVYTRAPGGLQIMFPMISSLQELRAAREILAEAKSALVSSGIKVGKIQVGMMIEIPSAALLTGAFAKEVDFLSIGTNDLIQYTLAVDRMNGKVAKVYDEYHPAVLRLVKYTIDMAHAEGKPVGICGETAGNPHLIPVLFGMGVDELSMNPGRLLETRDLVRSMNYKAAKDLAEKVIMMAETSDQVKEYIAEFK